MLYTLIIERNSELALNTTSSVPHVYFSISEVTRILGERGISKDHKASTGGASYRFRGIDDVYNALAPALFHARLIILPRVTEHRVIERVSAKGAKLIFTVVDVEYDLVSADDGSRHTIKVAGEAMDSGDKSTTKAMSMAYKTMAVQAFCIPIEGVSMDSEGSEPNDELGPGITEGQKGEWAKKIGKANAIDGELAALWQEIAGACRKAGDREVYDEFKVLVTERNKALQSVDKEMA